ncbi:unnamed protein product [Orchesella dallaii]|uniref:Dehydrogenase/reductase SDR family member 4 n=1 Tax=Orchesella dallaii TaxID=48710 RepID=A0ABP1QBA9_9HEXA
MLRQAYQRISQVSRGNSLSLSLNRNMASSSRRDLTDRVAIVTASTDGIGLAIAKRLANEGAKVMISSRKEKNVQRALEELHGTGLPKDRVKGVVCHVGSQTDREKLIDATLTNFGGVDILVSNAATNPHMGSVLDCSEEAWDKIFEINVKAAFLLTKELVPHLSKRKGSNVVYVSSIAGFQPFAVLGAYSVSKTALLGLTKVVAQELGPENIRVNCVAPGIIRTRFSSAITENQAINDKMMEMVPLGRVGEPEEIAGLVSFLVSDDASYVTGETYVAAGGQPSRL